MNYVPLMKPWAHQVSALSRLAGRKWFALQMAMRTGKTKVILDDFGRLEALDKADDMLVFAPAGVYHTWETAVKEHVSIPLQKRLLVYTWSASKNNSTEQRVIFHFMNYFEGPRILIMNIEAISSVERALQLATDFLNQRRAVFVIDESTTIKNDTIRTRQCLKLAELAVYRRILTGLIAPRSPLDVFYQFEFLSPGSLGHLTFASFKARYANEVRITTLATEILRSRLMRELPDGRLTVGKQIISVADLDRKEIIAELDARKIWYESFPKISGYKNEIELRDRIVEHSFRVRLEDCYDLPPKMYSMREVELTKEQKRIYKELRETATAELENEKHVTALSVITRIIRLHQILCGHTNDEEGNLVSIPEYRTEQLIDLLQETDGKAIIWCSYDYNVRAVSEAIEKEFGEGSVARFWGGNLRTREAEETMFQNDPNCRFMVGTPSAGGRGRLWVVADLVVYYSNTNNLEHRSQSEERAQGIDKIRSVAYIDLIVPGTVDEKIIYALRDKIDMAATISGDDWRKWLV